MFFVSSIFLCLILTFCAWLYELLERAPSSVFEGLAFCREGPLGRLCVPDGFVWLAGGLMCMSQVGVRAQLQGDAVGGAQLERLLSGYWWGLCWQGVDPVMLSRVGQQLALYPPQAQVQLPEKTLLHSSNFLGARGAAMAQTCFPGVGSCWLCTCAVPGPGMAPRKVLPYSYWLLVQVQGIAAVQNPRMTHFRKVPPPQLLGGHPQCSCGQGLLSTGQWWLALCLRAAVAWALPLTSQCRWGPGNCLEQVWNSYVLPSSVPHVTLNMWKEGKKWHLPDLWSREISSHSPTKLGDLVV